MTTCTATGKVLQFNRASAKANAIESLEQDGFAADIFHNSALQPPTWHFIISRLHDAEILYWGQERSLQAAHSSAIATLAALSSQIAVG